MANIDGVIVLRKHSSFSLFIEISSRAYLRKSPLWEKKCSKVSDDRRYRKIETSVQIVLFKQFRILSLTIMFIQNSLLALAYCLTFLSKLKD